MATEVTILTFLLHFFLQMEMCVHVAIPMEITSSRFRQSRDVAKGSVSW